MIIDESWQSVKVQCYCGYRGEETPLSFQMGKKRYKIRRVLKGWYEGERGDNIALRRVFRVVINKGDIYILVYDNLTDEWYAKAIDVLRKDFAGKG
ncbi:hypothetical protein CEE39_03790 [bacterium (candidate division B38) B3_B38]|nr:MAG: hypothetical protein CEE39_03790 [bacterium (candidate division B38) B3_B38]